MQVADQSEVISFLGRPETHGPGVERVERIETHGAIVFLAGETACKLKRAVKFPYMDFSTLDRRRRACQAEIRLNRRTAPEIYRAAVPVVRVEGGLRLGGTGEVVDWVVVMRRFDQDLLFDRLAASGRLDRGLMESLAEAIARFHAGAERRPDRGGPADWRWIIDDNRAALLGAGGVFDTVLVGEVDASCRAAYGRAASLLETRREGGCVRHCHGDLHLRNICLIAGRPTPFDAIEFNDRIACIDTLYDFAFVVMDLERVGLRPLANAIYNDYLGMTGDYGGLGAWPLFLACRAMIRAKTDAAAVAAQSDPARRPALEAEARACLTLARAFLGERRRRLIAVGGLSGSGKSTLARALAPGLGPAPGAVVVRTDVIRKRLAGVAPATRLAPEYYTPEASAKVYRALMAAAATALAAGEIVIADAVFASPAERQAIEEIARGTGVPFQGLWLDLPPSALEARVSGRTRDASDADVAVVRRQLAGDLGPLAWPRLRQEPGGTPEATLALARRQLI